MIGKFRKYKNIAPEHSGISVELVMMAFGSGTPRRKRRWAVNTGSPCESQQQTAVAQSLVHCGTEWSCSSLF